jgi:hypothetical protein
MSFDPITMVLEKSAKELSSITIGEESFRLPETIEESNLPGLNDYALVTMLKKYENEYEKNPKMKVLFGVPFRMFVFLYLKMPAFRRRMNWVFTTLSVYYLNYRYYTEKSLMPCRWDMTDEEILQDIERRGY